MPTRMAAFTAVVLCFGVTAIAQEKPVKHDEYPDFSYANPAKDKELEKWVESIKVISPAYRSDIAGDTPVSFEAPGMKTATVLCWKQPADAGSNPWGQDEVIARIDLDNAGRGTFVFKADAFPNGPTNIRILAQNPQGQRDICELQLYNTGGVKWNQGIPKTDPPAAKGLKLAFADDFDGPLSISRDGVGARYGAHKPKFGDFSGWQFADPDHPNQPFRQRDTYLHIAARKTDADKGSSGLISLVNMKGEGFWAKPPFYAECRFTAQSATGTWPAFWTITQLERGSVGDELDIVEAYGGVGKKNPNHPGYSITSHFWNQFEADGKKKKSVNTRVDIMKLGGKSYWSTTFHTYGLYVDEKDTVYYFDDIEVLRHPTNEESKKPHCLMVNYAIGGISGWRIDLTRYGNGSDMFVDYLRVYQKD